MEKLFRNEDGHEVTAINEVQANALEAEGFKAVKGSAKAATKNDAEFAEEMNFGGAAQSNATSNATSMDSAQAQAMNSMASQMAANAQDAEFAEEAAMAEFKSTDANNKMNSASKTAAKKTNK